MTQDELQTEREVRRFLLGEMSVDERDAFEEMFIADEHLFAQVRVGEDELIESYIRGTLPSDEKEKFERSFLTTERRRSHVEFTRSVLDKLAGQKEVAAGKKIEITAEAQSSVLNSILNFFKTPAFAFGAAFTLLVLILGGWFLQRNTDRSEFARQTAPPPATPASRPNANGNLRSNENVSGTSNANGATEIPVTNSGLPDVTSGETPDKNRNSNTRKQSANGRAPFLALFTGGVRGEGKIPELNLPPEAPGARLQLHLKEQDYKIYRVEVVDPDGNRVFRSNNLKVNNSKIDLFVPAKNLMRGDYLIKLSALNQQNELESVADYSLRVNRK